MRYKFLLIFLAIFLIGFINAESSLSLKLTPHYFSGSDEILVYDNQTYFTGISFEISAKNLLTDQRILAISIVNASPELFYNALPKEKVDYIRILQERILYSSSIIPTSSFENNNFTNFSLEIIGLSEHTYELQKVEVSSNILIINKEQKSVNGIINSIGKGVLPSNPNLGAIILLTIIVLAIIAIWYFDGSKRLQGWKRKKQIQKQIKIQEAERLRRQKYG